MHIDYFGFYCEKVVCYWEVECLVEIHFAVNALFSFYDPWLQSEPDKHIALKWKICDFVDFNLDFAPRMSVGAVCLQIG